MTASAPPASAPPRLDGSLIAALIGNFLVRLDGGMVGLMITLFLADINRQGLIVVTATTLGILSSVFYIVELGFSPIMGAKSDQHGNRALLLVGPWFGVAAVVAASLAALMTGLGWGQVMLVGIPIVLLGLGMTRLLQGFAAAASIPSILSYLSVRTEGSLVLRGRVMSIFEVTTAIGLLIGPVVGTQIWKYFGAWGFIITGVVFLASAAFFWVVREDSTGPVAVVGGEPAEPFLARLRRLMRRRDLLIFVPAWLSVNAIVGLWGIHVIYQMRTGSLDDAQFLTGHFSEDVITGVLGGYGLLFCVGIIFWGSFVLGRWREVSIMRLSVLGLFLLCAAVFGINHSGGDGSLMLIYLAIAAAGLAIQSGFAPAAVTYLARLAAGSARDRGLLMGIYSVVLGLGQFLGIGLGGRFADLGGVDGILLLTLSLGVVATITILQLAPHPTEAVESADEVELKLHA